MERTNTKLPFLNIGAQRQGLPAAFHVLAALAALAAFTVSARAEENRAGTVGVVDVSGAARGTAGSDHEKGGKPWEPVETHLQPYQSIEVSTTERGNIEEVFVKVGDRVRAGDPLLKLDSQVLEANLAIAKAQAENTGRVAAAEADRKLNQDRFDIVAKLRRSGTTNSAEYERQKALLAVSEANLVVAREESAIARLQLARAKAEVERRILRSPIDGIVVDLSRDIGEAVLGSVSETLAQVVDVNRLRARAHVPYRLARGLEVGATIQARIEAEEENSEEGGDRGEKGDEAREIVIVGTVEFLSPLTDPATGTLPVEVVFDNAGNKLQSGLPAKLLVPEPRHRDLPQVQASGK